MTLLAQDKLKQLTERAQNADKQLLRENHIATLLIEAMDQEDLNRVTAVIDKLNTVKSEQLPKLTAGIEKAQAELNKFTAGGPLTKAWTRIKQSVGVQNPVVRVMTLANALEQGFSQIPTILRNNNINLKGADLEKSLYQMLSEPSGENQTGADKVDIGGKLKQVVNQLQKALSPKGIYGVFKKVPYVNSADLAQELVKAPLKTFSQVAQKIQAGAKSTDVAQDLKTQVTGQGEEQTAHTKNDEPTKPTQQTGQGVPGKPTTGTTGTVPPGEQPATGAPGTRGGGAPPNQDPKKALFQRLKDANIFKKVGLNDASAEALLKALDDVGGLKLPE